MKRILVVAMIFVSCQQQISLPETVSTAEEQKVAAFLNISDRNVQRDAFAMLSAKEKAAVWLNHIAEYKQKHEWTPMQLNLIESLERMATPENYASAEQAAITEVRFVKPWMAEAEKHFSAIEILELAFELNPVNSEYAGKKGEGSGGGEQNCICAVGSNFTCYSMNSNGLIIWEQCTLTSPCHLVRPGEDENGGCGFMKMSTCNGSKCGVH